MTSAQGHSEPARIGLALLWDLDNVAVPQQHTTALAISMRDACGDNPVLVAAGQRRAARLCGPVLESIGFTVLSGGVARQGADMALLCAHRSLRQRGVKHFAVASCDHVFAKLAQRDYTTVFTLDPDRVSVRLRHWARTIVTFHRVGGLFVPVPEPTPTFQATPGTPPAAVEHTA